MKLSSCLLCLILWSPSAMGEAPRGSITIERIAEIKHPTSPMWSPDGRMVAFLWDAAGKQDLFVVTPGQRPVQLTDFAVDPDLWTSNIGSVAWISPDQVLFAKDGQIWSVSVSLPTPERFSGFDDAGNFVLSPDRKQIAFIRSGQLWTGSVEGKTQRQVTNLPEPLGASTPVFSRDSRFLAFIASNARVVPVPAEEMRYNGDRIRQFQNLTTDRKLGIVSVFGGEPSWISTMGEPSAAQFASDGSVVFQEVSPDGKTREIKAAATNGMVRTLWKDFDPAWWSPTGGARTLVSPDGKSISFFSDRSGWIHLYVMPVDASSESSARQLTSGDYGTGYATWTPDSKRIAYAHSVSGNQMERFISMVDASTGKIDSVAKLPGVSFDPAFSPDGASMVYSRTSVEHALELYVVPARGNAVSTRLTDSMPPGLLTSDLVAPVPVHFPSRLDGQPVPATLIVPKNLDRTRKHPAIVWIHGSGADQNYRGWHPGSYRMYYSAHQYLAQQGYVILTPDYRGSSGYSRDWATGSYMSLGAKDSLDVAAGADYLKTLEYIDPDRIGVWGLSYGGFMTMQAVTLDPTLFRCAINVAGVADWEMHRNTNGPAWSSARMGTPVTNPDGYYRSAPANHVEKLVRPLMILHGTNDTNVPFRESLQLIDSLLKHGKAFDLAVYPGEVHFFRRALVLRDAWHRSEEFFDRHLKAGSHMASQ